jgi:hypothetical protein
MTEGRSARMKGAREGLSAGFVAAVVIGCSAAIPLAEAWGWAATSLTMLVGGILLTLLGGLFGWAFRGRDDVP